mgnify:CR=1 FL=1|jgi:excisionase family DNA binding protein
MFEDRIAVMNTASTLAPFSSDYEKRVYTVDEVQDILGVSKTSAYNLVKSGVFRCVKVGGQYRVSKKSFDTWLDALDTSCPAESQVCD